MLFYKKHFYKQLQAAEFALVGRRLGGSTNTQKSPSLFCTKSVDFAIFLQFLDILPKLSPYKSILFGKPWGWDLIQTNKYQKQSKVKKHSEWKTWLVKNIIAAKFIHYLLKSSALPFPIFTRKPWSSLLILWFFKKSKGEVHTTNGVQMT